MTFFRLCSYNGGIHCFIKQQYAFGVGVEMCRLENYVDLWRDLHDILHFELRCHKADITDLTEEKKNKTKYQLNTLFIPISNISI